MAGSQQLRKRAKEEWLLTQRERGVPSSANWNPTNPFTRRHQYVAQMSPKWIAANHCVPMRSAGVARALKEVPTHRIHTGTGRNDAAIHENGEKLDDKVHVEEGDNLLAPDGGVLGADMEDHDRDHEEGTDVEEARRCAVARVSAPRSPTHCRCTVLTRLEDEGRTDLDIPCVADGLCSEA